MWANVYPNSSLACRSIQADGELLQETLQSPELMGVATFGNVKNTFGLMNNNQGMNSIRKEIFCIFISTKSQQTFALLEVGNTTLSNWFCPHLSSCHSF